MEKMFFCKNINGEDTPGNNPTGKNHPEKLSSRELCPSKQDLALKKEPLPGKQPSPKSFA